MKMTPRPSLLWICAALAISATSSAADRKTIHGSIFTCLSPTDCASLVKNQLGITNTSGSTIVVIAPVLRDVDGNVNIALFFKTNTRQNGTCWALWNGTAGDQLASNTIDPVPGAPDQLRDAFLNIPSASWSTSVMCQLKANATLVQMDVTEG